MDKDLAGLLDKLPSKIKEYFSENIVSGITEIRLRTGSNIVICNKGTYVELYDSCMNRDMINDIFLSLCEYTVSAYEDQINNGYITLAGGHRVGLAGKYTRLKSGKNFLSEVLSLNIRLAAFHHIDIPDNILNFEKGLLIAGKPHSGKTTFLRSLCFEFNNINYTVCDERSEIYHPLLKGDFIINLPKSEAVLKAVRVMNPQIVICDEIGHTEETNSIMSVMHNGVRFVCSVHAGNTAELYHKGNITPLINAGVFDKIIFLENDKKQFYIKEITDV